MSFPYFLSRQLDKDPSLYAIDKRTLEAYAHFKRTLEQNGCRHSVEILAANDPIIWDDSITSSYVKMLTALGFISFDHFPKYETLPGGHHWTTQFVWDNVLQVIEEKLDVILPRDKFVERSDDLITRHDWIGNDEFIIENLSTGAHLHGDFSIFRLSGHSDSYEALYSGFHSVCRVRSSYGSRSSRLLVNCDSMADPIIPVIAPLFEEMLVLDNRQNRRFSNIITSFNPTHYLALGITRSFLPRLPRNLSEYLKFHDNKIFVRNLI